MREYSNPVALTLLRMHRETARETIEQPAEVDVAEVRQRLVEKLQRLRKRLYFAPVIGMSLLDKSAGAFAIFGASGWETGAIRGDRVLVDGLQVVAARGPAVPDPTGGDTVDQEARAALVQVLTALRQHGLISD